MTTPVLHTRPIRIVGSTETHYYAEAVDRETGIAYGTTAETESEALYRAYQLWERSRQT